MPDSQICLLPKGSRGPDERLPYLLCQVRVIRVSPPEPARCAATRIAVFRAIREAMIRARSDACGFKLPRPDTCVTRHRIRLPRTNSADGVPDASGRASRPGRGDHSPGDRPSEILARNRYLARGLAVLVLMPNGTRDGYTRVQSLDTEGSTISGPGDVSGIHFRGASHLRVCPPG